MIDMQQDMTDVIARGLTPHILKIVRRVIIQKEMLTPNQRQEAGSMLKHLTSFQGLMDEDSVGATVYSYWQYFFYKSLYTSYTTDGKQGKKLKSHEKDEIVPFWEAKKRILLSDNFAANDFYQRLIIAVADGKDTERQRRICQGGYPSYKGKDACAYNVAMSFIDAKNHLEKEVSSSPSDWLWKNVHVNEYMSQPWSMTKLKPLWHREIPVGGNGNTPCVSKYGMGRVEENKIFKSTHTANYKQVISFGKTPKEDVNLMSIDTGMSGNLFGGNYFTMNKGHLRGEL